MSGRRGKTIAVVQARTSSTRLPGKVLLSLAGEPMILRQLERIRRAEHLDEVVIATSRDPSDDQLTTMLQESGYSVIRGSLTDVLDRFCHVIDERKPEVVVRITADCPLISPRVIDEIVEEFHSSNNDYVSNTMDPTYPDGLDVEVVLASILTELCASSTDAAEREHVTLGVYRHPERFSIRNYGDPEGWDNSNLRWTVDNADDFAFVAQVFDYLWPLNPNFDYEDVLALLKEHPELSRTAAHAQRNAALNGLNTGVMKHGEA